MKNAKPSDWKFVRLGECCEIVAGSTPQRIIPEYWNGDIPWVTPKDLSNLDFKILEDAPEKITQAGYDSCSTTILPKGSILFSSRAPIGLIAIAGRPMCTNQGFKSFIPGKNVDATFLYWTLKRLTPQIAALGCGTTFKEVSKSVVSEFEIPLPPLAEQRRIAAILDKADAVRRKRQEAIRLTDALLRSAFLEMFGDPVLNPKGWDVVEMGSLLSFLTSGSRGWAQYYANKGSLFLRIQNVSNDRLLLNDIAYVAAPDSAESRRTLVQGGDVLLSITADLGRAAVVPDDLGPAHINQHLAILRVKGIEPNYLSAFLSSDGGQRQFESLNRAGVKAGLNFDDVRSVRVVLPPMALQRRWASFRKTWEQSKMDMDQYHRDSSVLFDSLVQRAFRGVL